MKGNIKTVCNSIEWGTISVAVAVLIFAGGFFGKIIWNHGARIDEAHDKVEGVSGRVSKIETTQVECQKQLSARLLKGDRSFEEISRQVANLSATAERLTESAKNLQGMVNTIDQRIWNGHERRFE